MKTAKDAAQYLADESVKVAAIAKDMDDKPVGSAFQQSIINRSQIMMDCAKMVAEWAKGE